MGAKWDLKIEGVFEKEVYATPTLMAVVVVRIVGARRNIPRAFEVSKMLPDFPELRHLRRVKVAAKIGDREWLDYILCLAKPIYEIEKNRELMSKLRARFDAFEIFNDYRIVQVPNGPPQTDEQLEAYNRVWPCKYAKNNYLINCLAGTIFTDHERLTLKIIVNKTLEILEADTNMLTSAGVVYRCNRAYGVGLSNFQKTNINPTFHATMLAIDHVATMCGGGQWKSPGGDKFLSKIQERLDQEEELRDHTYNDPNPYLCTNYDIFVTEEPCLMCIMGLTQSRIRRLFYLDAKSLTRLRKCRKVCFQDGAVEHYRIHRSKHLNHRFEAWKISLFPEEEERAEEQEAEEEPGANGVAGGQETNGVAGEQETNGVAGEQEAKGVADEQEEEQQQEEQDEQDLK